MADINIQYKEWRGDHRREIAIDITGLEYGAGEIAKGILDKLGYTREEEREADECNPCEEG